MVMLWYRLFLARARMMLEVILEQDPTISKLIYQIY